MILTKTNLFNFLYPISIIVEHLPFRETTGRTKITDFRNIGSSIILLGIKISFLQQHSILISSQKINTIRLISSCQSTRISQTRFSTMSTFCCNFNYTVSTLWTPDSSCGSILQHWNFLNIFRVNIQQLCEFFIIGSINIKVRLIHIPYITVHNNQRFCTTYSRNGGSTTKTHTCTRTQVTWVGHNIQTGNTSLQSFIYWSQTQTFEFLSINSLRSKRNLSFRNSQTGSFHNPLGCYSHILDCYHIFFQHNLIYSFINWKNLCFQTHKANFQLILRVLYF